MSMARKKQLEQRELHQIPSLYLKMSHVLSENSNFMSHLQSSRTSSSLSHFPSRFLGVNNSKVGIPLAPDLDQVSSFDLLLTTAARWILLNLIGTFESDSFI